MGYEKGIETKKRMIQAMYEQLKEKTASHITVRELSKDHNCSPAAIYRHFESVEYLIMLGSMGFFIDYMTEYAGVMDDNDNLLESYVKGWKLFNQFAFERPDLYHRVFWGQHNGQLPKALQEYFQLFPMEGSKLHPAYFYTLLFEADVTKRDFLLLRRAVSHNLLNDEDAEYFSMTNTLIVKGVLEQYMERPLEERCKGEILCNRLLIKNMEKVYPVK